MNEVYIRHYETRDRDAIRYIAVETALAGEPASKFIDGNTVLADALTLYFTDYEPESCFVAEINGRVVGYIIGAVDTKIMDQVVGQRIMGNLLWKALKTGFLFKKKNIALLWHSIISFFHGEFFAPDFSQKFPATLHINLLPEARGHGNGSALISAYLSYLARKRIKGVRMATISSGASEFFQKHGFNLLFKGHRSYLNHVIGRNLPLYIVGRRLSS